MIHPNMATMLSFITCDAAVSTVLWQNMLSRAAHKSFNQITPEQARSVASKYFQNPYISLVGPENAIAEIL